MTEADPRATLANLVQAHGDSLAALSRMLGRNDAYLQQFVTRGSPRQLAERDRRILARYFGVDDAALGGPPQQRGAAGILVPRIDAVASAGPGGLLDGDALAGAELVDRQLIARLQLRPADLSFVDAAGDSMAPTILAGDRLLVDRGDRRITAQGRIMVLRADDGLLVKRVSAVSGGLRVASDNPAYPPVTAVDADIIGRVVWLSRALSPAFDAP